MSPAQITLNDDADIILVGGGLVAGILALRLAQLEEPPRILILEASERAFGDKTWSLQATDIAPEDEAWLAPAFFARWPRQRVRFERLDRELESGYASTNSASLSAAIAAQGNLTLATGTKVEAIASDHVVLADGRRLDAGCVIDARGHMASDAMTLGYQKFVGWIVETAAPHGIDHPLIMDSTVTQIDGFRFVYLLPFSPTRLLIEDTRYADGPELDAAAIEACIGDYAKARSWQITEVVHRETGVLPIVLAFDPARFEANRGDLPSLGMRAGLFHATTGYSLPDAVRSANLVAEAWPTSSAALAERLRDYAQRRARVQSFYRFLNRMLFTATEPERRHLVMQTFYRLPLPIIERFYAGRTTRFDMLRILGSFPPVPIRRAVPCIPEPAVRPAER